jgi:hypothetical protein
MAVSDSSQQAAVIAAMETLRSRQRPPAAQATLIAEHLGSVRDRVARSLTRTRRLSDREQLSALDTVISSLRRGFPPPRSERAPLIAALNKTLERIVKSMARERASKRKQLSRSDIRGVYYEEIRR